MKAAAIGRFGGLDELKDYDLPKPQPAADEVLIRVRAAGVGIWDSENRQGIMASPNTEFPLILGAECAGDVEQIGSNVHSLREKQPVYTYFQAKQGAYAQFVAVKANAVALKPSNLSYEEAAAVPVDGVTAHDALVDDIKLAPKEWLFVAGGAGGVGSMAVQIAASIGARVIASARADDFGYLESLGIPRTNLIDFEKSDVVNAVRELTNGKGADAALDSVGGENSKVTIRAVRDGGRIAELTGQKLPDERKISVLHVSSKPSAKTLDALRALFESGKLKVRVNKVFPLAQAREAQQLIEQRRGPGEIVLSVN